MRVGDQLIRRALDVVRQSLDGGVGVAGQGQIHELAMFGGQVAVAIGGQRPPPPPVQLGTVTQAQDNFLQAGIVAARSKGLMKVAVANTPLLTVLPVVVHARCALQEVMGGNDLHLPPHVPALDRQAQRHRLNLHTRFREAGDVFDGKLPHPKATLWCRNDQAPLGQHFFDGGHGGGTHSRKRRRITYKLESFIDKISYSRGFFDARFGDLGLAFSRSGFSTGFDALRLAATTMTIDGVSVPVASLDDVITSKEAAARDKDFQALPHLIPPSAQAAETGRTGRIQSMSNGSSGRQGAEAPHLYNLNHHQNVALLWSLRLWLRNLPMRRIDRPEATRNCSDKQCAR
jgi:hypothetical protein